MLPAYIESFAYVPLEYLGDVGHRQVKSTMTIRPRQFGDAAVRTIRLYSEKVPGYIGLPIDWALNAYDDLAFEDRTTDGAVSYYNKLPDPHHPRASPGQATFMADLDAAAADYFTTLAIAPTGAGKTVTALRTAALRGRRTLIIVPLERHARQWAFQINEHLGIPMDDIGWVQGDVCNYDHPYVVAIGKSLAMHVYPRAFYHSIGTAVYDEGHRFGAPLFAGILGKFYPKAHIMLTANENRKDGTTKVLHYYFGRPKVEASQPALETVVYSVEYLTKLPKWAKQPGHIAQLLGRDNDRNDVIHHCIGLMYRANRVILVIGDSVEHLQKLVAGCIERGIPASKLGLYVDKKYTDKTRLSYSKLKYAARGERLVYWKPKDGDYLFDHKDTVRVIEPMGQGHYKVEGPSSIEVVHVDELRKPGKTVSVMEEVSNEELDYIEANAQIIFATFGIFKESIDIPRLDAGIDATPRADGEQAIGRIRRPLPNKLTPVWYTIRDKGHAVTEAKWKARIKDYRSCNCRVEYYGEVL